MKPLDKEKIGEKHLTNERTNERTIPEWDSFINGDCMEYMKDFPDDYFDLAIVDPPYGAGLTEGGGCKGWFSKYHQTLENSGGGYWNRFGGRFDRYKTLHVRTAEEEPKLREQAALGRGNTQKNHCVGCCAG